MPDIGFDPMIFDESKQLAKSKIAFLSDLPSDIELVFF